MSVLFLSFSTKGLQLSCFNWENITNLSSQLDI